MWLLLSLLDLYACTDGTNGDRRFRDTGGLSADEHVPVVIVGGGVSGLAVGTRLEEALILEGSDKVGGRAILAGGLMFFADYPEQTALGEEDSLDEVREDWVAYTGEEPTEATELWLEDLDDIYDGVTALGLDFTQVFADPILHKHRLAMVRGGGSGLAERLATSLPEGVETRLETWVDDIWMQSGRVLGVVLSDGTVIGADVTVIASGGFAGSVSWVGQLEEVADLEYGAWGEAGDGGATGSALDWAQEHGWATRDLDKMGWFRNSMAFPGADGRPFKMVFNEVVPWVWVNQDGERFVDESYTGSVNLSTPWREQEAIWGLTTEAALESHVLPEQQPYLKKGLAAGEVLFCDSGRSDLTARAGLDLETLEATLAEIAAARASGETDSFGRDGASFTDYESGALCAFKPGIQAQKGFGGLDVDTRGRVLDADGDHIPGLYAVGEAAGMAIPGMGGLSGFDGALSAVLWSGWRVGDELADD